MKKKTYGEATGREFKEPPVELLRAAISKNASVLASYLYGSNAPSLQKFSLVHRAAKDYIAVMTRLNQDTLVQEVAFGTGTGALGAIIGLCNSIAKGAWKPDKFQQPFGLGK